MKNPDLRITLLQPDTYWENPDANRAELEEIIAGLEHATDLIILPETFTTGFSGRAREVSEPMNFNTHKWMKMMAAQTQAAICGSVFISEHNKVFNRLLFVTPDGETIAYDKKHLFSMGAEGEQFTPGNKSIIINWKGWRIKPLICYDLRFPVWARNRDKEYDILMYSANWPASRSNVWNTLLPARAIENQCYVAGVNRVGTDGNGHNYIGESQVIDPKGMKIAKMESNPGSLSVHLSLKDLQAFREKFPVWRDADDFEIK